MVALPQFIAQAARQRRRAFLTFSYLEHLVLLFFPFLLSAVAGIVCHSLIWTYFILRINWIRKIKNFCVFYFLINLQYSADRNCQFLWNASLWLSYSWQRIKVLLPSLCRYILSKNPSSQARNPASQAQPRNPPWTTCTCIWLYRSFMVKGLNQRVLSRGTCTRQPSPPEQGSTANPHRSNSLGQKYSLIFFTWVWVFCCYCYKFTPDSNYLPCYLGMF